MSVEEGEVFTAPAAFAGIAYRANKVGSNYELQKALS
jgi:hypothetical protein